MLQIGSVTLKTNLLLAPIAGYCDLAYRLIVRSVPGTQATGGHAVGLACTDLLCPQAILRETDKTLWLAATCPEDSPCCMQLYGRYPDAMAAAAEWAVENGAVTIDINMGCPVDKVTKKNGGSKLLCEPGLAVGLVERLVRTVNVPVTCKIRLGWDDTQIIADTLPPRLADAGAAAITVHGRTTEMKFRGNCRLDGITQVVEAVKRRHPDVAVIGNGDVKTPQDAKRMLDVTGGDGVMIGRAALREPWLFRETAHFLATGEMPAPLPRVERALIALQHFENLMKLRDERAALAMIRQRMSWYSANLQPWPLFRREARALESAAQVREFMANGMAEILRRDGRQSPVLPASATPEANAIFPDHHAAAQPSPEPALT